MEKRFVFVVFSLAIGVVQSVNAEVPAIFVLGDSTSDVGTNNYLPQSTIKANFPHHGVDFPFAIPTGRFSNGFNTADYLGPLETEKFLSKSLFFISIGSNDIMNNYYSSNPIPKEYFIPKLGLVYKKHLRNLISLGARKFGIVSVPALGCCPSQRIYQANGECLEELNNQARAFFSTMELLLGNLRLEYKDIKYSLGNTVDMTLNVIDNALAF
ncbi:hypothetical protein Goarm_006097, partial [Gossypium armourianum]|nr:hypothetical protein [Gossypium armourianum]